MFERFTQRASRVIFYANEESRALQHSYVGTEHLLLGLLREEEGIAAKALTSLGFSYDGVREKVIEAVGMGKKPVDDFSPWTPRAHEAFNLALREGISLKHTYISTEHILLGLSRQPEGLASKILQGYGGERTNGLSAVQTRVLLEMRSATETPFMSVSEVKDAQTSVPAPEVHKPAMDLNLGALHWVAEIAADQPRSHGPSGEVLREALRVLAELES